MLTDTKVKTAPFKEKPYKMYDSHGLYIFVTPKKAKLWRLKYKFQGKEKLMSFGGYPIVTLAKARERRSEALRLLDDGVDPMTVTDSEKGHSTAVQWAFNSLSDDWLKRWRSGKDPKTIEAAERRLGYVKPFFAGRELSDIQSADIVAMLHEIQDKRPATVPSVCLQVANQVFRYGVATGVCKHNPAAGIRPQEILGETKGKNFPRVNEAELPRLLCQIDVYPSLTVRLTMKMMALTFVRTMELITAEWSEIDFEKCRWDIPKEKMKGKKLPHIVPLSNQAIQCLRLLRELKRNQWVFPGVRLRDHIGRDAICNALQVMGYKGQMTGHGFRGVASTILHEQGYDHKHIEIQLAHNPESKVSGAYNYALYLDQRKKMMQEWADYLDAAMRGKKPVKQPHEERKTQHEFVVPAHLPM